MTEPATGQPRPGALHPNDPDRKRRRLFRGAMIFHCAVLVWWPFSIQVAAREPGVFPETIQAYLLASTLLYPVFVAAAFYFARKGLRSPAMRPFLPLGLALPFASGTWWMFAVLIVSVLTGR